MLLPTPSELVSLCKLAPTTPNSTILRWRGYGHNMLRNITVRYDNQFSVKFVTVARYEVRGSAVLWWTSLCNFSAVFRRWGVLHMYVHECLHFAHVMLP